MYVPSKHGIRPLRMAHVISKLSAVNNRCAGAVTCRPYEYVMSSPRGIPRGLPEDSPHMVLLEPVLVFPMQSHAQKRKLVFKKTVRYYFLI